MNNYTILYEVTSPSFIPTALLVLAVIDICIIVLSCLLWKKEGIDVKILFVFLIIFFSFCTVCYLHETIRLKTNVTDKYFSGEYEIVEGVIHDYYSNETLQQDITENFYVGDVNFILSSFTGYGYLKKQRDGGALKNGMKVRICYIPYKYENVMMKVEAVLDE